MLALLNSPQSRPNLLPGTNPFLVSIELYGRITLIEQKRSVYFLTHLSLLHRILRP